MKSNSQFRGSGTRESSSLVDPEAYDASEQQFAASLECGSSIVAAEEEILAAQEKENSPEDDATESSGPDVASAPSQTAVANQGGLTESADPDAWRQEVAARVKSYQARRRPRAPRYPSLQLKFEPAESAWTSSPLPEKNQPIVLEPSQAATAKPLPAERTSAKDANSESSAAATAEPTARVLPFRRAVPAPPPPLEELAEPMQLFPRILEVPEVAPPPPALGGILIEPEVEESTPKRPGIEIPLQTASLSRRIMAAMADALVLLGAFSLFAYIFFQITATVPPLKIAALTAITILGMLWAGYEYLLVTYAGTTPGLWLARLRLSRFDGSAVPRKTRRWRAITSVLSALSLGLGYAWCMLDEDQLCWHDRITRTHLAPR